MCSQENWPRYIVQDFRELNEHSHIDKYSMKEINECIGDKEKYTRATKEKHYVES